MSRYLNRFLDAGISDRRDQEKYTRCLDVALAQEGITERDIVGIGEHGTGSNLDLYVVHRDAITLTCERGIFNKRIDVQRLCTIASIARLRETQEGYKGTELTITGHDAEGQVLFRIEWGLTGPDWVEPLVRRQLERLFELIGQAMDETRQRSLGFGSQETPPHSHPLLPPDIVARMTRYGRHKVDPHTPANETYWIPTGSRSSRSSSR
jgi:hypothetical protein